MTDSNRGVSAEIAVVVIGDRAFSGLSENLAVDWSADLAVDLHTDLAVRPDITWRGSTSQLSITVLGGTADSKRP